MKKLVIIIIVILFASVGFAGIATTVARATSDEDPVISDGLTVLTVYGSGSVKLEPDVAYINLGVVTRGKELKAAQDENSQNIASVIAAIKGVGVKEDNIQTSGYNIYPQYDRNSNPPVIEGYEIRNELSVTITDINSVGIVLDAATKAGSNSAGSISFGSLKEEAAYTQALELAFKKAKEKAEALAKAAGMKVKTTISISEGLSQGPSPLSRSTTFYAADEMSAVPIEAGLLTINADVTVIYSIK